MGLYRVDVEHNRTFGKEVHRTSRMVTTMVPVPPPTNLRPVMIPVDNRAESERVDAQ
ncbi:MAG: hypothetical protein ABEJ59_01655 [Halanaeroarchaeum sp.]